MEHNFRNPDYTGIYLQRQQRLAELRKNPDIIPQLALYYRDNVADFISDWGMTSDPRNAEIGLPVVIPFILFPRQREWVEWIVDRWKNQEDGLTEKSRDMGISWLAVAVACSLSLFYRDLNIGFGSRKEDYVDKSDDPKSLFYKARQFIQYLPPEFTGNWDSRRDSNHMLIRFPETKSTLTGEAGDNIGRGNRAAIYFKDESAFYERGEKIDAALSQTSNCKIDVSTPNGPGNAFYRKRFSGNIPIFTFHWKQDPRKDEEWYEKQKRTLDPVVVAQEIDIDYMASVEGVLIPGKWVQAAINAHETIGWTPTGARRTGLDVADEEGRDENVVINAHGTVVLDIDNWKGLDTHQTTHKASAFATQFGSAYVNYDSIGVGAGVRGSSKSLPIMFNPVAVSESPTNGRVINNPDVKNGDYYAQLGDQLGWEMRVRFERTYQHVNGIKHWTADEMISIPNHPGLIMELSQPLVDYNDAGKIKVESKKHMKRRGIKSPNYFDALKLAFAPVKIRRAAQSQGGQSMNGWGA